MSVQRLFRKINSTVKKKNSQVIEQVITELEKKETEIANELNAIIPPEFVEEHKLNPDLKIDYKHYWRKHNRNNLRKNQICGCEYCYKQQEYVKLKLQLNRIKRSMHILRSIL